MMKRKSSNEIDAPKTQETVEEFLMRGGRITFCPPRPAMAESMYSQTLTIDGIEVPVGPGGQEYVPNFVRDIKTYDIAQQDPVTAQDDGSHSIARADARRAVGSMVNWRERVRRQVRDGSDNMEMEQDDRGDYES